MERVGNKDPHNKGWSESADRDQRGVVVWNKTFTGPRLGIVNVIYDGTSVVAHAIMGSTIQEERATVQAEKEISRFSFTFTRQ